MSKPITSLNHSVHGCCDNPLHVVKESYRTYLGEQGYASSTQSSYLSCISHFGCWLAKHETAIDKVDVALVARFVEEHLPCCGCPGRVQRQPPQVRAALRQLLVVLRCAGITWLEPEPDAVQVELACFDAFLRDQRGLAATTRYQRGMIVGDLLRHSLDARGQLSPLSDTLLRACITRKLERWSPASGAVLASALRAYLHYRSWQGDDVAALLSAIVSPANWRLAGLPETLSDSEVERVLASFAEPLASRRRAAAIAQCVARLGMRACEVVGLELEDLDWEGGTIRLRQCKSRRADRLPMLSPVGEAISKYLLQERPACLSRRVFVRHVAPVEKPLRTNVVGRVIRDAYSRCNLPYSRVHIFRHSLATRVLDGGGSLKEVADVLRHRSLDTAQIYAKLDERRLSAVAMPWPGDRP